MRINNPSNDIINYSLDVPVQGRPREVAIEQDIQQNGLDKNSVWRRPVTNGIFWEKILRPICNLFEKLQKWCQYQDFKHNLSALKKELQEKSTICVRVIGLNSPEDTKKIFHVYTRALGHVIDHSLDSRKRSELHTLLGEIDTLVDKKEFSVSLPKELDEIKQVQRAIYDNDSGSLGALQELEEQAKSRPDYASSTLEREIRYAHCLIKAKEVVREFEGKSGSIHDLVSSLEKAKAKLLTFSSFTKLDSHKQEAIVAYFNELAEEPFGKALLAEEQKQIDAGQKELETLKQKIEANSFSESELKDYQSFIRTKLSMLSIVDESVIANYKGAKTEDKAQFFSRFIEERLKQSRHFATSLRAIDSLITAKITPPTKEEAKETLDEIKGEVKGEVVDITSAAKKTGFRLWADGAKDAALATVGWATGSRDMLATSCSTYSFAIQAIGASATFAIYAGLGSLVGNFGHLGSIAYGIGAVSLSLCMPDVKKDLMPNASKSAQLLSGPIVMATYALIAPAVYALSKEQLTPLRDAQKNVTENILGVKKTIDSTSEHATALNKTIPEVKKSIDSITLTTKEMQQVNSNMRETITGMKEDVTNLRAEIPVAQRELEACQPNSCVGVVKNITNRVEAHIVKVDQKAELVQGALDVQLDLNKNLQGNLTVLDQKNTVLQTQVGQLQEDGKALLANNTKLQESVNHLENIINPQRSYWDVFSDSVYGGAVGAAGVGLLFIPGMQGPGALLISAGAGYAAGFAR